MGNHEVDCQHVHSHSHHGPRRGGQTDATNMKRVCCGNSSTPSVRETVDGDHRWWTRIGTQYAMPSTKDCFICGEGCQRISCAGDGGHRDKHDVRIRMQKGKWQTQEQIHQSDAAEDVSTTEDLALSFQASMLERRTSERYRLLHPGLHEDSHRPAGCRMALLRGAHLRCRNSPVCSSHLASVEDHVRGDFQRPVEPATYTTVTAPSRAEASNANIVPMNCPEHEWLHVLMDTVEGRDRIDKARKTRQDRRAFVEMDASAKT